MRAIFCFAPFYLFQSDDGHIALAPEEYTDVAQVSAFYRLVRTMVMLTRE